MQKSKLQFKIQTYFKNFKFLAIVFSFSLFTFGFAIPVYAIELFFEPRTQEIGVGQDFRVNLMIDTQGQEINAVAAIILFPEDLVDVKNIEDGSSILTLWVERPSVLRETDTKPERETDAKIKFAGIIPGGFNGIMAAFEEIYPGKLLTLTLTATKEGTAEIFLKDAQVLLHDGKGTEAKFSVSNFKFSTKENIETVPIETAADIIPPEHFVPEIARDPNIFDGKWFLVFVTQDKNSGIDYYEVCERREFRIQNIEFRENFPIFYLLNPESCQVKVESPYLLKDQELRSYIFVKAVDKAGNERIVTVEPKYPVKWYEIWWIWGIIILGVVIGSIIIYAVRRSLWRKRI